MYIDVSTDYMENWRGSILYIVLFIKFTYCKLPAQFLVRLNRLSL